MKIFRKIKYSNGKRDVFLFGIKVYSYMRKEKLTMFNNPNKADLLRYMGVIVGSNVKIWSMPVLSTEYFFIEIGDNTTISSNVTFLTHDGSMNAWREFYNGWHEDISSPLGEIKIGKNCFIGANATILPDVTIGDNCVIGAGSVVTKNVPNGEVWAGNPAHFIKTTKQLFDKFEIIMHSDRQKNLILLLARREFINETIQNRKT